MRRQPEVERLLTSLDQVIDHYSDSSDADVQKYISKLKRIRKKFDPPALIYSGIKLVWLADKIKHWLDWFDQVP